MRITSNKERKIGLLEFGLRRAQGPMGGIFASKYSYLAFDAISNVLSGYYYKIPVRGTCAHAYIMSYQGQSLKKIDNSSFDSTAIELFNKSLEIREQLKWTHTNLDELLSFATFTSVYKESSNLLVDTFNTIESGVKNAILISLALNELTGNVIKGVRLDSGDLPELSKKARQLFINIADQTGVETLKDLKIAASNDINLNSIQSFNSKGHEMDIYGIGTNLVTCQLQPFMEINTLTKITSADSQLLSKYQILYKEGTMLNEKDLNCSKIKLENSLNKIN